MTPRFCTNARSGEHLPFCGSWNTLTVFEETCIAWLDLVFTFGTGWQSPVYQTDPQSPLKLQAKKNEICSLGLNIWAGNLWLQSTATLCNWIYSVLWGATIWRESLYIFHNISRYQGPKTTSSKIYTLCREWSCNTWMQTSYSWRSCCLRLWAACSC